MTTGFKISVVLILLCLVIGGCAAKETTNAWFEATDCKFSSTTSREIECGYLHVPEDRTLENSPEIQLHVAVVKSSAKKPEPDPIVFLMGGPGVGALDSIDWWVSLFQRELQTRDLIVFDQRGTGYSLPLLNCPEAETPYYEVLKENLTTKEENAVYNQEALECQKRLIGEGINLAVYTSADNAADVNDLRITLGHSQVNLYGGSYGTRLALTVMRDFPQGIRSVILDSAYPPQVNRFTEDAANKERALNLIFERCAMDTDCNQKYPDLETVFYNLADQLDSEPVTITVYNLSAPGQNEVAINGDRFIYYVSEMISDQRLISLFPEIIYELHDGHWGNFPRHIRGEVFLSEYLDEGMHFSVMCGEELAFTQETDFDIGKVNPRFYEASYKNSILDLCQNWQTRPVSPVENEPVISDIPTLILAGDLDPYTPPEWGTLAAETLDNAQYVLFPGFSHGILGNGADGGMCTFNLIHAFLSEPYEPVDTGCVDQLPGIEFAD